jgi:hypothetical protein
MKVLVTPEVRAYFDRLETILYEKGYFSFEESSHEYVDELSNEIRDTLPTRPHRRAPAHFDPDGRGVWYATFRRSRATTWYVFFTRYDDAGETVFLVRRIENNHTAAHYF